MAIPLHELMDSRYSDRGGYKTLAEIFGANLPYEMKIKNVQEKYIVSRGAAVIWYAKYRAKQGLR
jgi:hypothetical protein